MPDSECKTLITVDELRIARPAPVVFDCRHRLSDPGYGHAAYLEAHIPGARFAHLDANLSGTVIPGRTGRHPLPDVAEFTEFLRAAGVSNSSQLVAYDDAGGAIAARFWWLLRWLGHDYVAVLDGGFQAWIAAGEQVDSGTPADAARGSFEPDIRDTMIVTADTILAGLGVSTPETPPALVLMDARAHDRFDGTNETIDPVAGHIPGAVSVPFAGNLDDRGFFRSAAELQNRYANAISAVPGSAGNDVAGVGPRVATYCGSGVTAAHNVLAMVHAGLPEPALYAGSWSEWIADGERPVDVQG